MSTAVAEAYARRAGDYIGAVGSMDDVHPADIHLVGDWAHRIEGGILDAGCGPGQWTGWLEGRGADVRGIDQVEPFLLHARRSHPGARFDLGSLDALPYADAAFGGVLAWYSLIHHDPSRIAMPLGEFRRVLAPGGAPLVGFFIADATEPFDHAITRAYRWSAGDLADVVAAAGFDVVETHTRTQAAPRPRPHGALIARRRG